MAKYIDADRLKAEIEKLDAQNTSDLWNGEDDDQCYGYDLALDHIKRLIDSLQQEQPKKSKKDCDSCPHCVDRKDQYGWHFKGCFGGPYNGKFIAEIDECPLTQEQPEVDLEKESLKYFSEIRVKDDETPILCDFKFKVNFATIARHFFELGLKASSSRNLRW